MGIFSRNKQALQPNWGYKAAPGSIIWRLLISPNGLLIGEERNPETKTSSLFAIDVPTGKTLWKGVTIDEAWWFTTARATVENIYIHRFRKPDMPEPLGIIALDIISGAERWEQPDVSMLFELNGKVYAQREAMGRTEFFALDAMSGEVLEAFGSERAEILSLQPLSAATDEQSIYSYPINQSDELFSQITTILADVLDANELRGSIDFSEFAGHLIFSYHERKTDDPAAALNNLLVNRLAIVSKESGDLLYRDTLASSTPYPVPDNFFIHQGILIYVKETTDLIGIPL